MAMLIWPTDGADGSVATEFRWRMMARVWRQTGILPEEATINWGEFQPTLNGPTSLTVLNGAAWIDGHFVVSEDILTLTITDPGMAVIHVDPAANSASVIWKPGNPTPIQNPTGVYEVPICRVSAGVLTDLRLFPGAWRDYTPSFVADGASFVKGQSTITGRYRVGPKSVDFRVDADFGSGVNGGSGWITIGLPPSIPARFSPTPRVTGRAAFSGAAGRNYMGYLTDANSTTQFWVFMPERFEQSNLYLFQNSTANQVNTGIPLNPGALTINNGNSLRIQGSYETN